MFTYSYFIMYKLHLLSINYKENNFFVDTEFFDQHKAMSSFNTWLESIDDDYKYSLKSSIETSYENDSYINLVKIYYFKTIHDAESFCNAINKETSDYRLLIRKWNSDNNVLSKFYIYDDKNNIVKTLTDCEQHICQRFNGQCSSSGCSKVEFAASLKNNKIIPIALS